MPILQKNEMAELLTAQGGACLSLFMSLQQGPDKVKNNRIQLKNLHKSVQNRLNKETDLAETQANLLAPIESLLENGRLSTNSSGLAIFAGDEMAQTFFLPKQFRAQAVVDKQFYIKPLLPLLNNNRQIFLLTLSQNQVRLFQFTQDSIEQMAPEGLPESLDEALALDDPEKRQQYHTSTESPQAIGKQPAAFHTHNPKEEKKSRLRRFFQQIDKVIVKFLADTENAPLIIAGVDYLLPIYREANNYSHLLEDEIEGNMEHLAAHELHKQVQPINDALTSRAQQAALARFEQLQGSEFVSTNPAEIIAAAHYGRIETLFAAQDKELWGTFAAQTGQVAETAPGNGHELTNFACRHALLNNGDVYLLPEEIMPHETALAAIFRYVINS